MSFLQGLRRANEERQKEWEGESPVLTVAFRANELAGETGEACNILKKLDRERLGLPGSCASIHALAEELADVTICTDLLAMAFGVQLDERMWKENAKLGLDYSAAGAQLAGQVGRCCLASFDEPTQYLMGVLLSEVVNQTKRLADRLGIDLQRSVTTKFNMTSAKRGFKARLAA